MLLLKVIWQVMVFSVGGDRGYTKTFEEHGYIVSIVSIVPKAVFIIQTVCLVKDMKRSAEEFALPVFLTCQKMLFSKVN